MTEKSIVFSLTSNVELTKEVCKELGISVGKSVVKHFADGEIMAHADESVRGKRVYVIQSTYNPVTDHLMELLVFIDSLRRASAQEITAVIPYYGYARQDRMAEPRQPITARLVADLLKVSGVDRVVTIDLHAPQIQGFFSCPLDNLSAMGILASKLKEDLKGEDVVVVSPDHGGVVRARNFAAILDCPIAIFDKRRPKPNVAEMLNIIGDVKNKVAVLVDDIIDTGGTIISASEELIKKGANKVLVAITHPVLSGEALDRLEKSKVDKIITTNTIVLSKESKKVEVISLASLIAQTIESIDSGVSIAPLFEIGKK